MKNGVPMGTSVVRHTFGWLLFLIFPSPPYMFLKKKSNKSPLDVQYFSHFCLIFIVEIKTHFVLKDHWAWMAATGAATEPMPAICPVKGMYSGGAVTWAGSSSDSGLL